MVSMKDISVACGVSTATVSKALHDAPDISESTKEIIRQKAEELGYFPNAAARALKTNRTYNIGVLFKEESGQGMKHEYFSAVLDSLKKEAESQGYDITFINTRAQSRLNFLEHCKYRNFDGVAVVCANFSDKEIWRLVESSIPVVTLDYVFNEHMAVLSNNAKGMEDLVSYIHRMGHRKIAYIHGAPSSVSNARTKSFYRTMEKLELEVPEEYVRAGVFHDTESSMRETAVLLDLKTPPTCIIFPDDFSAMGGINEIRKRGLRIPEDISIAGYDGIQLAYVLQPQLTTLHQNTEQLGTATAKKLIELIEQPKTTLAETIIIEGMLEEGGSVKRI